MNLYLMRHANAGVPRESAKLDAKRGLIAEGKEQCMLMGRLLGALKVQPDIIVRAPFKQLNAVARIDLHRHQPPLGFDSVMTNGKGLES